MLNRPLLVWSCRLLAPMSQPLTISLFFVILEQFLARLYTTQERHEEGKSLFTEVIYTNAVKGGKLIEKFHNLVIAT